MKPEIQKIILEYYPNLTDLKRTWECAGKIEQSMIDAGYLKAVRDIGIQDCPFSVDQATVPKAGIEACPEQVVLNVSISLVRWRKFCKLVESECEKCEESA